MQTGATTLENGMEFPHKTENGSTFWPTDSVAGNISKDSWNTNSKEYIHPYVHSSVIYNSQDLETA